jgi:hypothetical protein
MQTESSPRPLGRDHQIQVGAVLNGDVRSAETVRVLTHDSGGSCVASPRPTALELSPAGITSVFRPTDAGQPPA